MSQIIILLILINNIKISTLKYFELFILNFFVETVD